MDQQNSNPWSNVGKKAASGLMAALFGQYMPQPAQQMAPPQQEIITPAMYSNGPEVSLPSFPFGDGKISAAPKSADPKIAHIQQLADQFGVHPDIATGVFGAESSFGRNTGPSKAGAIGPMQVMPGTMTDPGYGVKPAQGQSYEELARVGMEYLAAMKNKYGNYTDALVAYNWGPGNADKWKQSGSRQEKLPDETMNYLRKVARYAGE
jgi:soluble lytic murein transglycosylase-like protein